MGCRLVSIALFLLSVVLLGGCGNDPYCPEGQSWCWAKCVDLQNDKDNCGACDNACESREECVNGNCVNICTCISDDDCAVDSCCFDDCVCAFKDCAGLECGPDPVCGFECGQCDSCTTCSQGLCEPLDKVCTTDADCQVNECCQGCLCLEMDCTSLECGPDHVCGKECGPCPDGNRCNEFGKCVVGGPSSWVKSAGGISEDCGTSIASLDDGSSFVTGHFYGTATFGPGEVNETALTTAADREHYMFIARYDPYGKLIWAKCAGDWATSIKVSSVSALPDGSSVVTGSFLGKTAAFGLGEENETVLTYDEHNEYLFAARYNPDGTLAWARSAGGDGFCAGNSMAVFSDGSSLVAGSFYGTATFGLGENNETLLISPKDENGFLFNDIFIARFRPDGSLAWARQDGGLDTSAGAHSISVISDGAFLVAGGFWRTAVFGSGESNETTLVSDHMNSDMFVAQYLQNGVFNWVVQVEGESPLSVSDISAISDGSFVVVGPFQMNVIFGNGEANETELFSEGGWDIYIAGYNPDGTLSWARREGGPDWESASSVSVNDDGSFIVGGEFSGTTTFGIGESNETTLTSAGCTDSFVAKYLPDGTLEWVVRQGGPVECDEFIPHGERNTDVLWLPDGSIMATGYFDETATFFPGESHETSLNSAGWWDMFVMKIGAM